MAAGFDGHIEKPLSPEHQRVRQTRGDGSVVIYAGAQEVETQNQQVTVKTYWPMGIGVEIDRPGAGASELNWVHRDRLGSVVAITDASGGLKESLAYDAWGKRRMLTTNVAPDTLDGVTDNKGFTSHEMLDQLDLVHMNGGVRSLHGAVPVGGPACDGPNQRSELQPLQLVLNNPTDLTDPTGFDWRSVDLHVLLIQP